MTLSNPVAFLGQFMGKNYDISFLHSLGKSLIHIAMYEIWLVIRTMQYDKWRANWAFVLSRESPNSLKTYQICLILLVKRHYPTVQIGPITIAHLYEYQ